MTFQVVATLTNNESLCIGPITSAEVAIADNEDIDGVGTYLISVDNRNPLSAGQVLAKFSSEEAARKLAAFFRISGHLEAVA